MAGKGSIIVDKVSQQQQQLAEGPNWGHLDSFT
jgi:hypothetical protein